MIKATVLSGSKTAATELPCDKYDLYEVLQSIGIRESAKRILLTDNEGDDIRVRLPANTEVMKTKNEIGRILDTRGFDIVEAKKRMLECVSLKYNCIPKDNNISERMKAEFEASSPLSTFSSDLFGKTVSEILLEANGEISLRLKNGQVIRKESNS